VQQMDFQLQAHLAAIVDSSDDAILTKDLSGTILSWNPAAERLYGYAAEEIVGRSVEVLVPEDRKGEVQEILRRIASAQRVEHFETVRVARDGRRVAVSLTISPVRGADGNVTGASTIARDITGLLRERAALEEQAELLDIAQDAIMARDMSGRITYWNGTAEQRYGWSKEEALGQVSHELLRTQFPQPLSEIDAQLLATGRWEGELVHTTRSGTQVIDESRWVLRRDGVPGLQVLEVNNDVTDRKVTRDALGEREAVLSAMFEASPDVIAVVTSRGEVQYVNGAAESVFGYPLGELLSGERGALSHPDDAHVGETLLRDVFGEAGTGAGRIRVKSAGGEWLDIDIRARRMSGSEKMVLIARDVTEQVQLEADLRDARDAAENANQAKSEFLSRMSHELRTPLNAILGFGQLLEMEDLAPDQVESVQQMVKGGRRLLELINEVLDIARVESGTLRLSLEPVSIGYVVRESVDLIRPLAVERGIELRSELDDEANELHVLADRQRLGQVLLNLLSNAVKYNIERGRVSVRASRDDDRVWIGVTDTGPGVAPDQVPLLFTPFERLGADQSSVEGTGLGLALSKSLVEAMGGVIEVDTMMRQGTTFWVALKRVAAPSPVGAPPVAPHVVHPSGLARKILYIEDNISNLTLVEHLVAHAGDFELISAMTGNLGIELARQHRPNLVLLDMHLPDVQGEEVLIRLRKDPLTADIPIVILSADATPGQIARLRAAGANDYLTKPIEVPAFTRAIDMLSARTGS
jgi:PAS domain S-box-containing protein